MLDTDKKFYITTPIYYVNDKPHIGHAYTTLSCDVLSRFKRLDGYDVKFLTGTDEHGQKIQKAAEKQNKDPQEFADEVSMRFRALFKRMSIEYTDFIRTTEQRHKDAVTYIWNKIYDAGYIYKGTYGGWYAIRDEAFYKESELIDGKAPTGAEVTFIEEESYFFALSRFEEALLQHYESDKTFIMPRSRRNEVVSFVRGGLEDLSISRKSFSWGIPVPNDSQHVIYVWFDALTNYISALGYPGDISHYWPCDLHVVGKDILRFHCVYWPALLMAAQLPLPKRVFAHGWWTNEGHKISKSLGNVIDPYDLIKEFGLEYTRYYLMRDVVFGNDGNYSRSMFLARVNSELVNNIGNLSHRVLSFIFKYCDRKIPDARLDKDFLEPFYASIDKARDFMDMQDISRVLEYKTELASKANAYIEAKAPWKLRKTSQKEMEDVLYTLCEAIKIIMILLQPFIPESSKKLLSMLGVEANSKDGVMFDKIAHPVKSGYELKEPEIVFHRLEED